MSHTSTIKAVLIKDINALEAAVNELRDRHGVNIELKRDTTPRAFYNNQEGLGKAPFVAVLGPDSYDVGFYPSEDQVGAYEARCDTWGGSIARQLGTDTRREGESHDQAAIGKLTSLYAAHATMRAASLAGHSVSRVDQENGDIEVLVNLAA